MALRRYTRPIDGTIPVPALLYDDEEKLADQDNVGVYDGAQKSPEHQAGCVYVSTHRLFYVDAQRAYTHSFVLPLSAVFKTDYYAGLFKSSPKVTLYLSPTATTTASTTVASSSANVILDSESWECPVCSYRNPPGLSPAAARICALCGVPRDSLLAPTPKSTAAQSLSPLPRNLSSSLPSSSATSLSDPSRATTDIESREDLSSVACPACTFLNHPSLPACEICTTPLPRPRQRQPGRLGKSAPPTRAASPDIGGDDGGDDGERDSWMIRLSFRKGGDKSFYAILKRSLKAKAWEAKSIGSRTLTAATSTDPAGSRSGINGILRHVETSAQSTATEMSDALKDLEAFMIKAKAMVKLAAELNERLTAATSTSNSLTAGPGAEPEEVTFIRSSLSQLGLQNTPVTQDMIRDEHQWTEELAKELAAVLQGGRWQKGSMSVGLMKDRGVIALDEVWGGWNRARGVALIPPSTFLLVLPYLPSYTYPPIQLRTFPSGLMVLHAPPYTHKSFTARLIGLLDLVGPQTAMSVAREENLTISMTMEMIAAVEAEGHICRDDGSAMIKGGSSGVGVEVRWWKNVFRNDAWDGQDSTSRAVWES